MSVDDLSAIMWSGAVTAAAENADAVAAFKADTGLDLHPTRRNGLEALIDRATGYEDHVLHEFIRWFTVNHWGLEHAPRAYRNLVDPRPEQQGARV